MMNDDEIRLCFSYWFNKLIKEKGYTQRRFAEVSGLSERCISLYRYGGRLPRYEHILLFANILGCTPNDLMQCDYVTLDKAISNKKFNKAKKYQK